MAMRCTPFREALSARLDGETIPMDLAVLDAHVAACDGCTAYLAGSSSLARRTNVATAPLVPDLTASILTAVPPVQDRSSRVGRLRVLLGIVGVVQLVLAVSTVLPALDPGAHTARELGVFELSLAVGFLLVARLPRHAAGLLPVVGVVAVLGVLASISNLAAGVGNPAIEVTNHVAEIIGAVVVAQLATRHRDHPAAVAG